MNFLFWNLKRNPLTSRVVRLAGLYELDVLMLAESVLPSDEWLDSLNGLGMGTFWQASPEGDDVAVFVRLPTWAVEPVSAEPRRMLTYRVFDRDGEEFLLVTLHLPSLLHRSEMELLLGATRYSREIIAIENRRGHRRTVAVGDFNMNPFSAGMVASDAFHAVMTKERAREEGRIVDGKTCPFFYNPKWGFFGDRTAGPAGTYYYDASKSISYFWNIYDQVLLRPALKSSLEELVVVTSDGQDSLVHPNGIPDQRNASDHLPIFFKLST